MPRRRRCVGSGVTATNYTDTTGVAGNTYYYVVKAVNGCGDQPRFERRQRDGGEQPPPPPKSIWPASTI